MTPSFTDKKVFAIGDCHGHVDRLEALLLQEGIIGAPCAMCRAANPRCPNCKGEGIGRIDDGEYFVVQLGDLGHFGRSRDGKPGSPTGDLMAYQFADRNIDLTLWGNHDRAVVDSNHAFGGYIPPRPETRHIMGLLRHEGRMKLAFEAHGFLLTHAGLHKTFKHNNVDSRVKEDARAFAEWINRYEDPMAKIAPNAVGVRDAISTHRGGRSTYGGILWRDAGESLYPFVQVFGHTAKDKVRTYHTDAGPSYCIDVGTEHNGRLAGIWLPEERVVGVKL